MIIVFHYLYVFTRHYIKFLRKMPIDVSTTEGPGFETRDIEENLVFDPPVYKQRYGEIQLILLNNKWIEDIRKIVDFGCAELKLFQFINRLFRINDILAVDVDEYLLRDNLFRVRPVTTDYICKRTEPLNVHILQGSISDPDPRLTDVDAVIGIEIIEHLYPDTLEALPYNVFGFIKPKLAVFTTPNADFNVLFPNFKGMRHWDHKFEWTREQFEMWGNNIVTRFPNYSVSFKGIGEGPAGTDHLGCCSQMAIFIKNENEEDCVMNSTSSFGICTYHSYTSNISIEYDEDSYYRLIELIEYPFHIDERTAKEKISDELKYKIGLASRRGGRFYNEDHNRNEIPVVELIYNLYTHFTSIPEACSILTEEGFKLEECLICDQLQICVIHEPEMENGTSTSSNTLSDDFDSNQDHYEWHASVSDPESDWGADAGSQKIEQLTFDPSTNAQELIYDIIENLETDHIETAVVGNGAEENPSVSSESNNYMCDSGYGVSSFNLTSSAHSCLEGAFDILHDHQATGKLSDDREEDDFQTTVSKESTKILSKIDGKMSPKQVRKKHVQERDPVDEVNVGCPLNIEPREQDHEEAYDVFEEVENGDLANNNRDLEGNNYPNAAENEERNENDNENAVLQDNERNDDIENRNQMEEDAAVADPDQQVEDQIDFEVQHFSREALFDPNSQEDLLEDYDVAADGDQSVDQPRPEIIFVEVDRVYDNGEMDPRGEVTDGIEVHDEPHFYCQGDGLGVHPSFIEEDDYEEDTSSDRTLSSDNSPTTSTDGESHDEAEADPSVSEVDVGSLPEDGTDAPSSTPSLRVINLPLPVTLQNKIEVKPELSVSSSAGSSNGTTSQDEFFDTIEETPPNSTMSQKHIHDPKPKK
ncbi:hypothetical protein PPYR_06553 [Photinus pyralis]|uniref:Small RNA 2'-O-methyltransferase n=3 Tax=Photinus pyralis TaxID=7054 RepID=A0A1Y1LWM0_PHOPY|nr:hypothetical protein PPYR_06553 [Photinus pyralis]